MPNNKPTHTLLIGYCACAIWENHSNGKRFFTVTFEKRYKAEDGKWTGGYSFGRDDLLSLSKLADMAHTWILVQQTKERENRSDNDDAPAF